MINNCKQPKMIMQIEIDAEGPKRNVNEKRENN